MFERRLKMFFAVLAGLTLLLAGRAAWVQIVQGSHWKAEALNQQRYWKRLEPTRGRILDHMGRVLAEDEPCMEAAVYYRAIERDSKWMSEQAWRRTRARADYRGADAAGRKRIYEEEKKRLGSDLDELWSTLSQVSGQTREQIEQIKLDIQERVKMRQRFICYTRYRNAVAEQESVELPWYKRLLMAEPELDSFMPEVAEQTEAHAILPSISTEIYNYLKKNSDRFPGLVLRPGKHRVYRYGSVAAHVMGKLARVTREDLENDANAADELRKYELNDWIGRGGVEELCEHALRGVRGRLDYARGQLSGQEEPRPGADVRVTLDIELQRDIEQAFRKIEWHDASGRVVESHEMHGAAVAIDVKTGEVRALVSWPSFDPNTLEEQYAAMAMDEVNKPLLNRATQAALVPGSTVKPIVGLGAITQGLISSDAGISCSGALIIDGVRQRHGRCWVASRYPDLHIIDHGLGRPLTVTDAIQRSCNVFFETLGERFGLEGLSLWFERFGLGRKTEIGIPELRGRLPREYVGPAAQRRPNSWFSAIGQGQVAATPLQMANVAATIARDGVWVRPKLVDDALRAAAPAGPDRVDLHLSAAGLAAVKLGMYRVVNTEAGSGYAVRRGDVNVAGKTGTAQTGMFSIIRRDREGNPLRDERGRILRDYPAISTRANPNPAMPWYRGSGSSGRDLSHAWFIGYAPAEQPEMAFAVMLEYGGGGGSDAAPVVRALLDACIKHGYLSARR